MLNPKKTSIGFVAIITVLALAIVALAGCGNGGTTTTAAGNGGTTTTAAGEVYKFAESNPVASNQHQMAFEYGKREMCKLLGAEFVSANAELSPDKQVSDIDTFIQMGVAGISSWTLDQGAATAVYQRAQDKGIPVVTENSPGDFVTTVFIQEQNVTRVAQEDAAKWFAELIPGAKIFIIGGPPVPYILYVTRNMEIAAEEADLTVLSRQDNLTDQADGAQVIVQDLLTAHPDVQAIWCFNDRSALGASAAVRGAGKTVWDASKPDEPGIIITGMNGTQEALEAIQAGVISATYEGQSEQVGAAQIELLHRIASGEMTGDEIPSVIVCPYRRWDGSNIADAIFPLQREIKLGILDEFMAYGTDPATMDDFLEFVRTL